MRTSLALRILLLTFLSSVVVVMGADHRQAELIHVLQPLSVRGVNYFPRETPWGGLWTKTPQEVWEKDMATAASVGANTVRTFLQFSANLEQAGLIKPDGTPAALYLQKIDALLSAGWKHGIRFILCFEFSHPWLAAPDAAARTKKALSSILAAYGNDGRVLLWDLMNEPDDDAKWNDATRAYLQASIPLAKELDAKHLVTVGLAYRIDRLAPLGLPDVLQYHEYAPKTQLLATGAARVALSIKGQRQIGGTRPLLIGEFGMSTARDPQHGADESARARLREAPGTESDQARLYEIVLEAAEKERVAGTLAWCLHDYPIKDPNESHFGLVRADGTLKPAASVLRAAYARWKALNKE